ncbi:VanZ family protein [Enterovibrio sp. ZSDZ42]|uniref:VanZ family protein n=1 Tax=Enterovibrio gelatinilyticus TaxID=2899819 RepID=A0ABT5QY88_9GAMM|nr:VanZ family protein [Enterovibrio sp. ZSDZ42]MDD1792977.1 VanZ family protein [Enterovibrio sp. ZSDZ42]
MANVSKVPLSILVVFVVIFGSASVLKSADILGDQVREAEIMIGGAIYLHLCGSFFLGILCRLTSKSNRCFGLPLPTLFVLMLLVADESLQSLIPSRQFSWLDMTVNVFGLLSGTFFCSAIATVHSKTKAFR